MIAGHFATALVPYELTRKAHPAPVWLFLLAAQFLDLLMVTFVSLGIVDLVDAECPAVAVGTLRVSRLVREVRKVSKTPIRGSQYSHSNTPTGWLMPRS